MTRSEVIALCKTPLEKIIRGDVLAAAYNADKMLADRKFLVELACRHKAYTGALRRVRCLRCNEMLRRSVTDGSEDYESFRAGIIRDGMIWLDDPCRCFNERTDLAGNFI